MLVTRRIRCMCGFLGTSNTDTSLLASTCREDMILPLSTRHHGHHDRKYTIFDIYNLYHIFKC